VPTYEYACEGCGNRYEKREGFDAPARQKCPKCKKAAQRVLFAPPVVFKGSGFYKTDSRGSSSEPISAAPATPAAPADGHGQSHSPGGHSHDAPAATPAAAASTTTETAAAG
jgi:putative FmdB family regulatory protein